MKNILLLSLDVFVPTPIDSIWNPGIAESGSTKSVLSTTLLTTFPTPVFGQISKYHKDKGDSVSFYKLSGVKLIDGLFDASAFDRVYVQKVYTWSIVPEIVGCDDVLYGGSGFQLTGVETDELPEEILKTRPDFDLWPGSNTITMFGVKFPVVYGFLTKGCFRNCDFCNVNKLHGSAKRINTLEELTNNYESKHVVLYDDSILASRYFFEDWEKMISNDVYVLFYRGFDTRMITDDKLRVLSKVKFGIDERPVSLSFTYDRIVDREIIERKFELLEKYFTPKQLRMYIFLEGDGFKDFLFRCQWSINKGLKVLPCYDIMDVVNRSDLYKEVTRFILSYIYYSTRHLTYSHDHYRELTDRYKNNLTYMFFARFARIEDIDTEYTSIESWAHAFKYPNYEEYLNIIYNELKV